jgi:hypothetical protein
VYICQFQNCFSSGNFAFEKVGCSIGQDLVLSCLFFEISNTTRKQNGFSNAWFWKLSTRFEVTNWDETTLCIPFFNMVSSPCIALCSSTGLPVLVQKKAWTSWPRVFLLPQLRHNNKPQFQGINCPRLYNIKLQTDYHFVCKNQQIQSKLKTRAKN